MIRHFRLLIATGVVALLLLLCLGAAGFFWLGFHSGVSGLRIESVSPATLAQAMADDQFYSNYNQATLLIQSRVDGVLRHNGVTTLTLPAPAGRAVSCQLTADPPIQVGQALTLLTEGAAAVRQPNGVLLTGCVVISASG
jgi:hypothetical protein